MLTVLLLAPTAVGLLLLSAGRRLGTRAFLVAALLPLAAFAWAAAHASGVLDGTIPTASVSWVPELGLSIDAAPVEALYLPCTGLASIEAIGLWERRTGKPAISSVQAGFWASLQRLGVEGRRAGAGRLIENWPAVPA